LEISVLSDGHLTVPTRFLARNVQRGRDHGGHQRCCNNHSTLQRDAGAYPDGDDPHLYVGVSPHSIAGAGKLAENMEAAGSDRRSISKIVLSHAHPDHLWGLLDDFDNTPMFPNAPI
jgi:glyoxylase-like metal-dependent hydrolase (beta-lactamase superfamily II)